MLRYEKVVKRFGQTVAVDNVTVDFSSGKLHALLGPNGSGKSTLMKMSLGVVVPDEGRIYVDSINPVKEPVRARKIIGYSPEEIILYDSLTPSEMISFYGSIYGIDRAKLVERSALLVKLFKLEEHMNKLAGELSHGNRRKLSLILALLHEPKVIILDEPFSGLDPEAGRVLKELLRKLASEGKTVIFSTHILELAEAVADEITIMHKGKIVMKGSKKELESAREKGGLEEVFMKVTGLSSELKELLDLLWRG